MHACMQGVSSKDSPKSKENEEALEAAEAALRKLELVARDSHGQSEDGDEAHIACKSISSTTYTYIHKFPIQYLLWPGGSPRACCKEANMCVHASI